MLGAQARVCADRADLPLDGARVVLTGRVMEHPSPLLAALRDGGASGRRGGPPRGAAGARRAALAFDRLGVAADADAAALAAALDPERRSPRWVGSPSNA